MADEADQAQAISDLQLSAALRTRAAEGPRPIGYCHYCNETVPGSLRWCDNDCKTDWEREQRAKQHAPRD